MEKVKYDVEALQLRHKARNAQSQAMRARTAIGQLRHLDEAYWFARLAHNTDRQVVNEYTLNWLRQSAAKVERYIKRNGVDPDLVCDDSLEPVQIA